MTEAKPVTRLGSLALIAGLTAAFVAADLATADARPRPAERSRTSSFQANKTFGLGIMIGVPTGLSGKYFLGPDTAIDFGLGVTEGYGDRDGVHLHADFLWHPLSLASTEPFELPLYFGVGGRFWNYEWRHGDHYHDGGALGARFPLGIAFDFNEVPIDIFIEFALTLDFLYDDDDFNDDFDNDGFDVDLNLAVGARYYFF